MTGIGKGNTGVEAAAECNCLHDGKCPLKMVSHGEVRAIAELVEEYIRTGRDQNIVDPDPHNVYTKRKEHRTASEDNISAAVNAPQPNYPSDGWSGDLKRMPFFTRAEMNYHIAKSGKNIDSSKSHSVPTSVRKATTFLNDEYLKNLSAASDNTYFYLRCQCHHSFRKNDPPHNLKVALCIFSGEVKNASCSCVAGQVGFCNHILALLLKLCKFSLYECKSVTDLENEDDMQPKRSCTSTLQQWHRKGRGDCINPQPVMEVLVTKTSLELDKQSSSRDSGVKCLLYEARNSLKGQHSLPRRRFQGSSFFFPPHGREEIRAPLKTPAWEARVSRHLKQNYWNG